MPPARPSSPDTGRRSRDIVTAPDGNALSRPSLADLHDALRRELPGWAAGVVKDAAAALAQEAAGATGSTERQAAAAGAVLLRDDGPRLVRAFAQAVHGTLAGAPGGLAEGARAAAEPHKLSLVDEDQIDADIETFRIARIAEDAAESELRRLAPLASRLQHRDGVQADAVPLPPPACARALRQALVELAPPRELRACVLAALGRALAAQLPELYGIQIRLLEGWGVQPAQYRIRQTADPRAAQATLAPKPGPAGEAALRPELVASLSRLVEWARRQPEADSMSVAEEAPLRLLDEPAAVGSRPAAGRRLPPPMARQLMQHLFAQFELQTGGAPWMAPLKAAGDRVATQQAEVWDEFDHPWWQLLDRLMSLCTLGEGRDARFDHSIAGTLESLQSASEVASRDVAAAVARIDRVTTDWIDQRESDFDVHAAELAGDAERALLEDAIREQIVARLRTEPPPDGMRRFVLGPWTRAMADAAQREGTDGRTLAAYADCLERLLAAGQAPASREKRRLLLVEVRLALENAGLDAAHIEAELMDLGAVLNDPEPARAPWPPAAPTAETAPMDLATVPIDMYDHDAAPDRSAWIEGLQPGARCRLFLHDRWHTASLAWVSANRGLFVFGSRHCGGVHPLTRRALEKLRNAGLAASIEAGELLAEALDRVTDLGELGAL